MYDKAKSALKIFWDNAKSKLPFSSFEEMIEYYRTDFDTLDVLGKPIKHDDFLYGFDKAVGYVSSSSDLRNAMVNLARSMPKNKTPRSLDFYDALSGQVESFTYSDVQTIANNTVTAIKDTAKTFVIGGASLWLIKVIGAFVIVNYLASRKK